MKKIMLLAVMVCSLALAAGPAFGLILSLEPSSQHIPAPGGTASVDLVVDGIGDIEYPYLGAFFLDITYDDTILSFDSVLFGDPGLGDLLDAGFFGSDYFFDDLTTPGVVTLNGVSFEFADDLIALQPSVFTLATLTFTGIAPGFSLLGLENVMLSSDFEFESYTITGARISVPEPATLLLLGTGLVVLSGLRRKLKRA